MKRSFFIFLFLLLCFSISYGAVRTIIGGAIQAPGPAPTTVSNISTTAVMHPAFSGISAGQHLGGSKTVPGANPVRFSNDDGVTWGTGVTAPFATAPDGFQIVGTRILVLQNANPCVVHYSDDNTTSWTAVSLTGVTSCITSG